MEEMFDIEKFNIISDEENYYFFRSLEPGDIKDLEEGNIKDENGKYIRLRTDRERWEETHSIKPRWNAESTVTLEEMYNHIKMHYSLETNCISLSSNANVARTYGETFSDKYVMIKVPKKEMGQRVYNAGQYMLAEIDKKVQERISQGNIPEEVLEDFRRIDEATESKELKEIIKVKYIAPNGIDTSKSGMKKGIVYKAPLARVSSFQALDDEQTLEKNKIVAKLTILEQKGLMGPAVPRIKTNSELIKTLGSAFASGEQIYYGDIEGNRVTDISKEFLDMFALIQQVENQDKKVVNELKTELVKYIINGGKIEIPEESILRDDGTPKDDISIEEMYQITEGKVEYGQASSIVKNMYYLSKGQANARILAGMLREIIGNNPKYEEIIKYIENNGFEIEPKITTRKSNTGYRISESVNLNLKPNEIGLVDSIKTLTDEEQMQIIQERGLSNVKEIMTSNFAKMQTMEAIEKEDYFASAIADMYDWGSLNIEEISVAERNELIQKLKQSNCVSIYEKLKEAVMDLLNNRDGLALGICNGFQALIKLGLVPEGKIVEQNAKSPTLTTNRIGRHISKVAYTRIASNLSPWFNNVHVDDIFSIPVSHGEGRFVADEDVIQKLFENGQVATQYVDLNGDPTMNEEFNPNGSYHAIEGITSPDGRVLGKMGHSERRDSYVGINIYGQKDQKIFESGVEYFK